jgi:uncharacterized membrane protein
MFSTADWKKYLSRVAGGTVGFGLLLVLVVDFENPPDILLFVGRFHPMVVHFPIGFLVLGGILEGISRYVPEVEVPGSTILLVLGLSAVSAVIAVAAGFFLSLSGGYNENLIGWHKWLGIAVAFGTIGALMLKGRAESSDDTLWMRTYHGVLLGTVVLLLTTGHLGGTLTHGSGYLTRYLPPPVARITGLEGGPPANRTLANVDSAVVFTDFVQPVLNERCVTCHNESKTKGELRLDTPEQIMEGGKDGEIITPGDPDGSEIVRRITLPLYHDDRMPPEGDEPLTVEETELIRWWIATGASFDTTVAAVRTDETPSSVETALRRRSRSREAVKTGIYALDVTPPDSSVIEELTGDGFIIRSIARDAPFLEVKWPSERYPVDPEQLARLELIARQTAWLDLADADITEGALAAMNSFEHLTRLHLERSSITDEALRHLDGLDHLKYLNLYGTNVTDAGLQQLGTLKDLKAVYLWQTDVTPQGVEQFQQRRPGVRIHQGASVVTVEDSTATDADSTEAVANDS